MQNTRREDRVTKAPDKRPLDASAALGAIAQAA